MRGDSIQIGDKFGRWTVVGPAPSKDKKRAWLVRCECGNEKAVIGKCLRKGVSKSCGCLRREMGAAKNRSHGMAGQSTYNIWCTIIQRTENPTNSSYKNYGGRGIKLCQRWRDSFAAFLADMGERPAGRSIERIDNDGDYCPENCRWATGKEQGANTRRTVFLTLNGKTATISAWAEITGIPRGVLTLRRWRGWSDYDILTTPLKAWSRNHSS